MPYALDDQHEPLISMHLHGWLSDAELDRVRADLDERVTRGQPFIVLLDCTGLRVPELSQVRQLANSFAVHADSPSQRGVAFVINTPMLRGTLRAIVQTQSAGVPMTVVDSVAAARHWAAAQLEGRRESSCA